MEVYRDLAAITRDHDNIITTGSFDGVHLGHRFIIRNLIRIAQENSGIPTLITFEPHPQFVVQRENRPAIKLLSTIEEKLDLLEPLGVSRIIVIPFTPEFSQISSETFVNQILFAQIGFKGIVVGYDHAFGKDREGGIETLTTAGEKLNFFVERLEPFQVSGLTISSSTIRGLLQRGEISEANRLLGQPYSVTGTVIHGDGRGGKLGFPTANILLANPQKQMPLPGVYAVSVIYGDRSFTAMCNFGSRPTFNGVQQTFEVHIFDFTEDIYNQRLTVRFHHRIRDEVKFAGVAQLIRQLQIDKQETLDYFQNNVVLAE